MNMTVRVTCMQCATVDTAPWGQCLSANIFCLLVAGWIMCPWQTRTKATQQQQHCWTWKCEARYNPGQRCISFQCCCHTDRRWPHSHQQQPSQAAATKPGPNSNNRTVHQAQVVAETPSRQCGEWQCGRNAAPIQQEALQTKSHSCSNRRKYRCQRTEQRHPQNATACGTWWQVGWSEAACQF